MNCLLQQRTWCSPLSWWKRPRTWILSRTQHALYSLPSWTHCKWLLQNMKIPWKGKNFSGHRMIRMNFLERKRKNFPCWRLKFRFLEESWKKEKKEKGLLKRQQFETWAARGASASNAASSSIVNWTDADTATRHYRFAAFSISLMPDLSL